MNRLQTGPRLHGARGSVFFILLPCFHVGVLLL